SQTPAPADKAATPALEASSQAQVAEKPGVNDKPPLKDRILSYLFGAYFFISSGFFVVPAIIIWFFTMPFDRNRRLLHLYGSWWAMVYVHSIPGWTITYEGVDNIDANKTYVVVSNHNSYWDIFVLYGLYKPFKFVSKESIFKTPFIGLNMYMNQY